MDRRELVLSSFIYNLILLFIGASKSCPILVISDVATVYGVGRMTQSSAIYPPKCFEHAMTT